MHSLYVIFEIPTLSCLVCTIIARVSYHHVSSSDVSIHDSSVYGSKSTLITIIKNAFMYVSFVVFKSCWNFERKFTHITSGEDPVVLGLHMFF